MTKEQFNHEMERIAAIDWSITTTAATQVMFCARYIESLEAENAALTLLHAQATDEMLKMQNRVHELEAENAKLEKLNSAALEQLSKYACPSNRNNYGQPCNDSDDCVACWREYLGGKDA